MLFGRGLRVAKWVNNPLDSGLSDLLGGEHHHKAAHPRSLESLRLGNRHPTTEISFYEKAVYQACKWRAGRKNRMEEA